MEKLHGRIFTALFVPPLFVLFLTAVSTPPTLAQESNSESRAQIVRLSYVQGDVRVSPGNGKQPDLSGQWDQAEVNLAIHENYALATGDGRAEIEFENGSTADLAENSVLMFEKLATIDGVPVTQLRLISGTATFAVQPAPGESFKVETTTDEVAFPAKSFLRVDSYLDSTTVTPLSDKGEDVIRRNLPAIHLAKGQPITTVHASIIQSGGPNLSTAPADWDDWVSQRVAKRQADTAAALKASGLNSFVPGLTDLYAGGTFFSCEPYGECWEPNGLTDSGEVDFQSQQANLQGLPVAQAGGQQIPPTVPGVPGRQKTKINYMPLGDCPPTEMRTVTVKDPITGKETIVQQTVENAPWDWAMCHSGTWAHFRGRRTNYTFVVGKKTVTPPVTWMKCGSKPCFVPRHPLDAKGKPPLNLKNGVLMPGHKPGAPVVPVAFSPTEKYRILEQPPKEFRTDKAPQLPPAGRPVITAQLRSNLLLAAKTATPVGGVTAVAKNTPQSTIKYDYKSHNFIQTTNAGAGPKSSGATLMGNVYRGSTGHTPKPEVVGSLSSHGQVRSGNSGGNGGYSGASNGNGSRTSGSGSSGGYSGGHSSGGNSGGGSHSGGSSGGGGYSGGGHSGGSSGGGGGSSGGGGGGGHSGGGSSGGGGGGGSSGGGGGAGGRGPENLAPSILKI